MKITIRLLLNVESMPEYDWSSKSKGTEHGVSSLKPISSMILIIKSLQLISKNCATLEQRSHGNQPDQTRLIVTIRLKKQS